MIFTFFATAAHPGLSDTNLAAHFENRWTFKLGRHLLKRIGQSAAMGALPSIRAAVDPKVTGGQYFGPSGRNERKGYPIVVKSNDASHNQVDARQLWQVSEKLTGVHFLLFPQR